jgi:hypothetical protein
LDGIRERKEVSRRFEHIEDLQHIYKSTFGKYGISIQSGSITLFHSSQWVLYSLVYNMSNNKNIRMLLGTLKSFQEPYIKYYENMLENGLKTKIICDPVTRDVDLRIEKIIQLKEKYPLNVDIRATTQSHGTSRRMIYDNMAIDGKKLLDFNRDLSYISTIYFQESIIARMQANFESSFKNSIELEKGSQMRTVI